MTPFTLFVRPRLGVSSDDTPDPPPPSSTVATKRGRPTPSGATRGSGQKAPTLRIAARSNGRKVVFLASSDIWAFEARDRLVFVHAPQGTFDIDLSLGEIASSLGEQFLRVHRNWLVNVATVRELRAEHGSMQIFSGTSVSDGTADRPGIVVPVARHRMNQVRRQLLANTLGVRPTRRGERKSGYILGRAQTPNS